MIKYICMSLEQYGLKFGSKRNFLDILRKYWESYAQNIYAYVSDHTEQFFFYQKMYIKCLNLFSYFKL